MKPPKSWLHEYSAQKSKHGNKDHGGSGNGVGGGSATTANGDSGKRSRGSTFGTTMDNSFRYYMARKIDLQRDQFGLVLPPPPPPPTTISSATANSASCSHPLISDKSNTLSGGDNNTVTELTARPILKGDRSEREIECEDENSNGIVVEKSTNDIPNENQEKKIPYGENRDKVNGRHKRRKIMKSVRFDDCVVDRKYDDTSFMSKSPLLGGVLSRLKQKHGSGKRYYKGKKRSSNKNRKQNNHDILKLKVGQGPIEPETMLEKNNEDSDELLKMSLDEQKSSPHQDIELLPSNGNKKLTSIKYNGQQKHQMNHGSAKGAYFTSSMINSIESSELNSTSSYGTPPATTTLHLKRQRPDLFFLGVTVMVNGYTNPCSDTIMRTLHKYGGNLEKYETERVTHIIAENLSTAKANIYKRQKKPTPVVKPKWIVQCVEAGKLLPYQDFLIEEVKDDNGGSASSMKSVKSFFTCQTSENVNDYNSRKETVEKDVTENSNLVGDEIHRQPEGEKGIVGRTCDSGDKVSSFVTKTTSFSGPRNVGNDPNFLESYFASSRLSFIGSFKQRLKNNIGNSGMQLRKSRKDGAQNFVFHVDMDCFFAAIAVRNYPQYKGKPVAVGHAWRNDPNGVSASRKKYGGQATKHSTSELSTCNYAARKFGVRKGMFAHRARQLCPELVILPYDYEGYEDASFKVASVLNQCADTHNGVVEQVSCDESYLELSLHRDDFTTNRTMSEVVNDIGNKIRRDILDATECTVSVGIGPNKLLSKLATDKVKGAGGDGLYLVKDSKEFLSRIKLRNLPGVGYRLEKKLEEHNLSLVSDVWIMDDDTELCSILGKTNGGKIFKFCQGEDSRPVKAVERKTIGAECNYGVRFDGPYGVEHMMAGLAKEVSKRMNAVGVRGSHITLKIKERHDNAPPPGKFNGHGMCDDHSKSRNLPVRSATRDAGIFCIEGMKLFADIAVDKGKIRGMGIVISKLESDDQQKQSGGADQMNTWLLKGVTCSRTQDNQVDSSSSSDENSQLNGVVANHYESHIPFESANSVQVIERGDIEVITIENDLLVGDITAISDDNIALPPLEDISMDDVMALPIDLREKVLSLIEEKQQASTSKTRPAQKAPDQKEVSIRKCKKGTKSQGRPKTIGKGLLQIDKMLKLASVKSGKDKVSYDGEQVSLTQLEHLPLNIQLQVVNNDNIAVKKAPRQKSSFLINRKPNICAEMIEIEENGIFSDNQMGCHDNTHDDNFQEKGNEQEDEVDDIKTLQNWFDQHPEPDYEDITKLKDFICICMSEMRLDDVVTFLRLSKRKSCTWTGNQYQRLLSECNEYLLRTQDKKLDLDWLEL